MFGHFSCFVLVALSGVLVAGAQTKSVETSREDVAKRVQLISAEHPRLFLDAAGFEHLKTQLSSFEEGRLAFERLLFEADCAVAGKPFTRTLEGFRLLGVCRDALHRMTVLAMAYRLTHKPVYLERASRDLESVCAFTDWNPSHFLDVAEMTLAVSICYDWLYNDLESGLRARIAEVILQKGLLTSKKSAGWVKASNNWGQVCHAGMMAGAFALAETHPDLAAEIIHRAIVHLPRPMRASFSPNGSYPEGPGYWSYGTDFNVLAIELLQTLLKSDFGLMSIPGFVATAEYMNFVTGPSGKTFNYADGGMGRGPDCALWWFARTLKRPDLVAGTERNLFVQYCQRRKGGSDRLFVFFLAWLQPRTENCTVKAPLCWSPGGIVPIAILRSSWNPTNSVFVGLKAGAPNGPHGHMDAGSFVYDAYGVRWAYDLGPENYNGIEQRGMNLWSFKQGSDRWKIFRLNNYSHNTLTLNNALQCATGAARVVAFDTEKEPTVTLDLTPMYPDVKTATRQATLRTNNELLLSDRLSGVAAGTRIRWQMMTRATVNTSRPGIATLSEQGKTLTLKGTCGNDVTWFEEDISKPKAEWDSANKGYRLVGFETIAPEKGIVSIDVQFIPAP